MHFLFLLWILPFLSCYYLFPCLLLLSICLFWLRLFFHLHRRPFLCKYLLFQFFLFYFCLSPLVFSFYLSSSLWMRRFSLHRAQVSVCWPVLFLHSLVSHLWLGLSFPSAFALEFDPHFLPLSGLQSRNLVWLWVLALDLLLTP